MDLERPLDWAYEALIAGRDHAEIALSYASEERDRTVLEVDIAEVGCRVHLSAADDTRVVDIVDVQEPESPPSRALGSRLQNLRRGGRVTIADREYTVTNVQSRYIAAHQDVFRDFPYAFPEHPGLQRMELNPELPTRLLGMLEARHEFAGAALRLYREKQFTLGTLSTVLGESLLDVWLSLACAGPGERVLANEARAHEIAFETRTVSEAVEL